MIERADDQPARRAGVGMVWFRYRAGVVEDAERLVHVADLPISPSYLVSPCGRQFDRCDLDEADDPARFPPVGGQARAEPCAVCVMRVLLQQPERSRPGHRSPEQSGDQEQQ
ncbi:hypothetical protein [Haloactinomyces albus]|uniref:Uncharacterized protein n=1 Tax=Haloactinomyces albus TaxID=1352928 RepID=A0AAE4CKX6_9ACTN|nr:hypothetical protein [Haloactinomyces albus]MDR7301209.1 hypothetical protein [Haloactinomyces albus]